MMAKQVDYIESWSRRLGLLPIPLFQNQKLKDKQFILLNGQSNNFCIDCNHIYSQADYRSFAWSSDVDNFITLNDGKLFLYRWFKDSVEVIDINKVDSNLVEFYNYLGKTKNKNANTIVDFSIRVFNKLRNVLKTEDGNPALLSFLYLLASLEDDDIDLSKWGLPNDVIIIRDSIPYGYWEDIQEEYKNGLITDNLTPNLGLILRHSAGRLFEEAHFAAFINKQLSLFGPSEHLSFKARTPQQYGAYFTPSYISRSIVEEIIKSYDILPDSLTVFDPACGSSEFLIEILRQLKGNNYKGKIKIIGWDASKTAINMSQFVLNYELREWTDNVTVELKNNNSLIKSNVWPKDVDILLMNPPFRSWELMSSEEGLREQVKEILGKVYNKNPNQAAAFFLLALDSIKEDGKLGCLLPSALFNSDSHKDLRKMSSETLTPLVIARLGSFVFSNALVDACMFIAQKSKAETETKILWTQNISNVTSKALRELRKQHFNPVKIINEPDQYSIYNVSDPLKNIDSWMPVSFDSANLKLQIQEALQFERISLVRNIFHVHRGADPGRKYFKISKEVYEGFPKKEKPYFRPCIESINIKKGMLEIANYLFYPKTIGLKPLNSEEDLIAQIPSFYYSNLLPNKTELEKVNKSDKANWWDLQRHRAWQEKKLPKLVSAAFGKAGDFAIDESGEFVVEQSCAWLPIEDNIPLDILYAYLSIFCSDLFNDLLKIYSKQLAGGEWYNLQTKHVSDIPIPDFISSNTFSTYIDTLSNIGKEISKGNNDSSVKLEKIVREVFNIQ